MEMKFITNTGTAPSSPVHHGDDDQLYYTSAPSSPSHISQFYRDFDDLMLSTPCSPSDNQYQRNHEPAEFAFDVNVSDDFSNHSVSADELFHGGVIKPMQLPPPIPKAKGFLAGALSPRHKKDSTLLIREKSRRDKRSPDHDRRGRESVSLISSSSRRSNARSLSPVRVSQYPWEEDHNQNNQNQASAVKTKPSISNNNNNKSQLSRSKGLRRLRDFFLFRSASEGRSDNKDPLRKYTAAIRTCEDSGSGSSGSVSKRKGRVSAHELHYTANRAVSEDAKKKTFLPYKQGILGRLAINPGVGKW